MLPSVSCKPGTASLSLGAGPHGSELGPSLLATGDGVRVPSSSGGECRTKHNSSTAEKSAGRVRCALTVRGEARTVSTEKERIDDRGHGSLQRRCQVEMVTEAPRE